jgi:hypothetical protein
LRLEPKRNGAGNDKKSSTGVFNNPSAGDSMNLELKWQTVLERASEYPAVLTAIQEVNMNTFVDAISKLLAEAYEGTTGQSWFSDHGPESGLFASLERISAENASKTPSSGGSSVAAHVNHLRWSLAMSNALMRGQKTSSNWAESWQVQTVNAATWTELKTNLRLEYKTLRDQLPNGFDPNNPMMVTAGVSLVAHAAYHLSAIRQLALVVRSA